MTRLRSLARRRAGRKEELCSSLFSATVAWCTHFPFFKHPICFWFILRCYCSLLRRVERPLLHSLLELCNLAPPPFRRSRVGAQRRMRCISLRSVCPRGPLRPLLSRTPLELLSATGPGRAPRPLLPWRARWTPAPPARGSGTQRLRRRAVPCTSRQYVDMYRSFAAVSNFFSTVQRTLRFRAHRPFGCIARPAVAVAV